MHILAVESQSFWTSSAFGTICGAIIVTVIGGLLQGFLKVRSDNQLEARKTELVKEVEQFKNSLRIDADAEVEKLKSKLRLDAFKGETRFRALHEEQAKLIKELYHHLHNAFMAVADNLSGKGVEGKAAASLTALRDFTNQNEIFFSENLVQQVQSLEKELANTQLHTAIGLNQNKPEHHEIAWQSIQKIIEPMMKDVRNQFRELIGV